MLTQLNLTIEQLVFWPVEQSREPDCAKGTQLKSVQKQLVPPSKSCQTEPSTKSGRGKYLTTILYSRIVELNLTHHCWNEDSQRVSIQTHHRHELQVWFILFENKPNTQWCKGSKAVNK